MGGDHITMMKRYLFYKSEIIKERGIELKYLSFSVIGLDSTVSLRGVCVVKYSSGFSYKINRALTACILLISVIQGRNEHLDNCM